MRKFKYRKKLRFKLNRVIFLLILAIIINTIFYIFIFVNRLSFTIEQTAKRELKEITTDLFIKNLTREKLKEITVEKLIIVNKNKDDEITDIDFKLDKAYEVLLDVKGKLEQEIKDLKNKPLPASAVAIQDNLVLKVPYYVASNNLLLMNLGPKIYVKINLLENVIGDVYTKVTSYGINTLLINLYIKIYITQSLLYPVKSETIESNFEVLVATKIIQGKIPSFYNGVLENSTGLLTKNTVE